MHSLCVADIIDINEKKTMLSQQEKPNIAEVIFSVQDHLSAILDNMGQKFYVENSDDTTKKKKYSLIDVRNFQLLSLESIRELFVRGFGINLDTQEGIDEINKYFNHAKDIFCERYGKTLPSKIQSKKITNVQDIQSIFKNTGTTLHGIYYCALSKLFYSYASFMKDIRVSKIDDIHEEITDLIQTTIHSETEISEGSLKGQVSINDQKIDVHFMHRSKSIESIVGKAAGNIDYNEVDDYKDLHGYTLEVDTQDDEDIILLMEQYYFKLYEKVKNKNGTHGEPIPDIKIENKGMIETIIDDNGTCIKIPALEKLKHRLDSKFYEMLKESIIRSEKEAKNKAKNKNTDHKYQDIKFKVMYSTNNPRGRNYEEVYSGVEIKIIKKGNENEKGTAFQPIFDYSKRFRELTRLVGYIRHTDIINFVNSFFEELDKNLQYKSIDRSQYLEELLTDLKKGKFIDENIVYKIGCGDVLLEIKKALYKKYESSLMKVKVSKKSRKQFYIHPSYYDLVPELQADLYKVAA